MPVSGRLRNRQFDRISGVILDGGIVIDQDQRRKTSSIMMGTSTNQRRWGRGGRGARERSDRSGLVKFNALNGSNGFGSCMVRTEKHGCIACEWSIQHHGDMKRC